MLPSLLLLPLLFQPQGAPPHAHDRPALAAGEVLELSLPAVPGTRVEHFRLDLPAHPAERRAEAGGRRRAGTGGRGLPDGLLRLHFAVDPRTGYRIESDARWTAERTRVLHVERLGRDELRLVRREIGSRHARSTLVTWRLAEPEIEVWDRSGEEEVRRTLWAPEGALVPLYVLEKARAGAVDGSFRAVDPRAGTLEIYRQETRPFPGPAGAFLREVSWRRADGALAGRFVFAGRELVLLQRQEGGAVARRIPAEEHERLLVLASEEVAAAEQGVARAAAAPPH